MSSPFHSDDCDDNPAESGQLIEINNYLTVNLDGVEAAVAGVVKLILDHLDRRHAECARCVVDCCGCIEGGIENKLDAVNKVVGRVVSKISRRVDDGLISAYSKWSSIGGRIPDTDEVTLYAYLTDEEKDRHAFDLLAGKPAVQGAMGLPAELPDGVPAGMVPGRQAEQRLHQGEAPRQLAADLDANNPDALVNRPLVPVQDRPLPAAIPAGNAPPAAQNGHLPAPADLDQRNLPQPPNQGIPGPLGEARGPGREDLGQRELPGEQPQQPAPEGMVAADGAQRGPVWAVPNWCDPAVCNQLGAIGDPDATAITAIISALVPAVPVPGFSPTQLGKSIGDFLLYVFSLGPVWNLLRQSAAKLGGALARVRIFPGTTAGQVGMSVAIGMLTWIERIFGMKMTKPISTYEYWYNWTDPYRNPEQAGVDAAWLAGEIDNDQWGCYTKANGNCLYMAARVAVAERERPGTDQVVAWWRRGKIDVAERNDRLRRLGVITDQDRQAYLDLSVFVPGPGDIIRYMVRNVYDDAIVKAFALDDEFKDKFKGPLVQWARSQGMEDDAIQAEWRAHWQIPAPTQLFEMLQRLRPGRVDPKIAVTPQDVDRALGENDVLPFWRNRLTQIAYNVPGRIDLKRLYQYSIFKEAELVQGLKDAGFDNDNAFHLAAVYKRMSEDWFTTTYGLPTRKDAGKLYRNRVISKQEYQAFLSALGDDQADITYATQQLDWDRTQDKRVAITAAVKKRYLMAEVNDLQAMQIMHAAGIDGVNSTSLVQDWKLLLQVRGKTLGASQLCGFATNHLISPAEYNVRLQRMGYSPGDAALIVANCQVKAATAANKATAAALKQNQAKAKAAIKELVAANKTLTRELDRVQKSVESAADRLAAARLKANAGSSTGVLNPPQIQVPLPGVPLLPPTGSGSNPDEELAQEEVAPDQTNPFGVPNPPNQ